MVSALKQMDKVFIGVTCKYDVYAQVINDIIAHDDDNKVRGNKSSILFCHINNSIIFIVNYLYFILAFTLKLCFLLILINKNGHEYYLWSFIFP